MAFPHETSLIVPDTLPFPITRIETEARLRLLATMAGSIAAGRINLDPEEALQTANRCVDHFEVITSALEQKILTSYDEVAYFNGYAFRICMPAPEEMEI